MQPTSQHMSFVTTRWNPFSSRQWTCMVMTSTQRICRSSFCLRHPSLTFCMTSSFIPIRLCAMLRLRLVQHFQHVSEAAYISQSMFQHIQTYLGIKDYSCFQAKKKVLLWCFLERVRVSILRCALFLYIPAVMVMNVIFSGAVFPI